MRFLRFFLGTIRAKFLKGKVDGDALGTSEFLNIV